MPISNRTLSDLQHLNPGVVILSGSFVGNAALDPTVVDFKGATVTHAGTTGRYNIVLPGKGTLNILFAGASVLAAAGRVVTVRSYTASTRTLVVDVYDLATPTAQDLTTGQSMFVQVHVKNSSAR